MKAEPASIADWRAAIEAVETAVPYFAKLQDASLRFLDSERAIEAIECGWNAVELFGLHKGTAPNLRPDAFGLLPFVAWGIFGHTIHATERHACVLLTFSGSLHRKPRTQIDIHDAIAWWLHPGL